MSKKSNTKPINIGLNLAEATIQQAVLHTKNCTPQEQMYVLTTIFQQIANYMTIYYTPRDVAKIAVRTMKLYKKTLREKSN